MTKARTKRIVFIAAALVLLLASVGGVRAWLMAQTQPVENTLVPASVTCAVEEHFENNLKQDVRIRNTGNIDAYIRATVVVTFVDDSGKVSAVAPREGVDYTLVWGTDWQMGSDGFWYFPTAVSPDGLTSVLVDRASVLAAPEGFHLNIQILATAIQSEPEEAVRHAWGVTVTDGVVTPN